MLTAPMGTQHLCGELSPLLCFYFLRHLDEHAPFVFAGAR